MSLPAGAIAAGGARMRRFGIVESDLAIDFADGDQARLITRLLSQCVADNELISPELFFRGLSVGKRVEYLLTLAAGDDRSPFKFPFKCSGCAQEVEMELTLDEIAALQREADQIESVVVEIGKRSYLFRKPTGSDQENWAGMAYRDEKEAVRSMLLILADEPERTKKLSDTDLDLIDDAMDDADPLVNFRCQIGCLECGTENEFIIDLCDLALDILSRRQQQLIVMVHKLASRYSWSEKEIFDIPHWRRIRYLDLIAAGR